VVIGLHAELGNFCDELWMEVMSDKRERDKQKLLNAPFNQEITIDWADEGGGLVYRLWDVYVLFEAQHYGRNISYAKTFNDCQIDELLDLVYSWT